MNARARHHPPLPSTRSAPRFVGAPWVVVSLGLAALALASLGCDARAARPPLVLVVSLDTVRADRWASAPTPAFDGLAARADRYPTAVSTAPWTLPSHASMFTGLWPSEHGAVSFEVDALEDNAHPLHPDHVTLAEALSSAGYHTAGFVANTVYLSPRHGLDQGFATWQVRRQRGDGVTRDALAWVDAQRAGAGRGAPLFLFLNYMDAHRPYNAPPAPDGRQSVVLLDELIERVMVRGEGDSPERAELRADLLACYDGALANLDAALGRLFDGLDARGLLDGALVVVTADHGESFGEHGLVEHSKDVYEPLLRVPFIVKRPGQRAGRDLAARASSVDVAGLVAEATRVGRARFTRLPGTHPVLAENRYSRPQDLVRYGARFRSVRQAWYEGDLKLRVDARGATQLFDLAHDPAELRDLALARPADAARLTADLARELARAPWPGPDLMPGALAPAERVELRALGYGGD
ncbi:MAG: sulfatase [Planctomycetota bacterium]